MAGALRQWDGFAWIDLVVERVSGSHAVAHQPGGADAMAVDAHIGTGSLRTLGVGPQQAVSGTDLRLSDARTPLAHNQTASTITDFNTVADARVVAGITGKADISHAHAPSEITGTAVITTDGRLTDARVPLAHNQLAATITDFSAAADARVATGLATSVLPTTIRTNLGAPSVMEAALIDGQATNKTWFHPPASIEFETSPDDVTFTPKVVSDAVKKLFVAANGSTGAMQTFTKGTYLRITLTASSYVYLNWLYLYASSNGNSTYYKIEKQNCSTLLWSTVVAYGAASSSWPGHVFIPHAVIPWHPSGAAGHYIRVRVTIKADPDSTGGTYPNSNVYSLDWWGGYPAGLRTIYSWDENKNVAFPAEVAAAGQALVKTDDTRLADARTPLAHNQTAATITDFNTAADARVVAGITAQHTEDLETFVLQGSLRLNLDDDGVPYFDNLTGSIGVHADTDGVPYLD